MLKILKMAIIPVVLSCSLGGADEQPATKEEPQPDFEVLETKDGLHFEDCFVTRVETDTLLIRHRGGMAQISLFDLDSTIQEKYEFDPIAALSAYKATQAKDRELRKQMLIETEKRRAERHFQAGKDARYKMAKNEWIPATGKLLHISKDKVLVDLWKIEMVPTKEISTLGFEREGPPKRKLSKFGTGSVLLKGIGEGLSLGDDWKGFVNPFPHTDSNNAGISPSTTQVYEAVSFR
tara:strand:+ start:214 stop:921 length:708 start_codon:yes stop_codon:yes gene_type:complete